MKKKIKLLLVALSMFLAGCVVGAPAYAEAKEFPHIDEVRAQFLAEMRAGGTDPAGCRLDYLESTPEAHFVQVQCDSLPAKCVVAVHPTEVLIRPIGCVENPSYDPKAAPKQQL